MSGPSPGELDAFLSDLIHDLRNLLEAMDVTVFAETPDPAMRDVLHREMFDLITRADAFRARSRLADDRAETPSPTTLELRPILEKTLLKLRPYFRDRPIETRFAETPVRVSSDREGLERTLMLLLHGATKLAGDGAIRLSLAPEGHRVRLVIELQGSRFDQPESSHFSPPKASEDRASGRRGSSCGNGEASSASDASKHHRVSVSFCSFPESRTMLARSRFRGTRPSCGTTAPRRSQPRKRSSPTSCSSISDCPVWTVTRSVARFGAKAGRVCSWLRCRVATTGKADGRA